MSDFDYTYKEGIGFYASMNEHCVRVIGEWALWDGLFMFEPYFNTKVKGELYKINKGPWRRGYPMILSWYSKSFPISIPFNFIKEHRVIRHNPIYRMSVVSYKGKLCVLKLCVHRVGRGYMALEYDVACKISDHPYSMKLIGPVEYENCFVGILYEFVKGIPLNKIRKAVFNRKGQLWVSQISDAVKNMHNKGIIHGDVKASNIIVTSNSAVIIDYDASFFISERIRRPYSHGTESCHDTNDKSFTRDTRALELLNPEFD